MNTLKTMAVIAILASSSSANAWGPYNNNSPAPYGYAPNAYNMPAYAPAPMTAEQHKARQAANEKVQKEAFERHQEAMKNFQNQAPPMNMPADVRERHDAFVKQMDERRAQAQKRHEDMKKQMEQRRQEMMKKRHEARIQEKSADNS